MFMFNGLNHVNLKVNDIERSTSLAAADCPQESAKRKLIPIGLSRIAAELVRQLRKFEDAHPPVILGRSGARIPGAAERVRSVVIPPG